MSDALALIAMVHEMRNALVPVLTDLRAIRAAGVGHDRMERLDRIEAAVMRALNYIDQVMRASAHLARRVAPPEALVARPERCCEVVAIGATPELDPRPGAFERKTEPMIFFMAYVRDGRLILDEPTEHPDGTLVELVATDSVMWLVPLGEAAPPDDEPADESAASSSMQPLRAHVRDRRLVLDEPTDLPDGTAVELVRWPTSLRAEGTLWTMRRGRCSPKS